LLSLYQCK